MRQDEYTKLYANVGLDIWQFLPPEKRYDHTLLYGYTVERNTFHVYMEGKEVAIYIYRHDKERIYYLKDARHILTSLVPNKRVYPETCDPEFCHLLISAGINIPFTHYDDKREFRNYYGDVYNRGLS
jgi:hypothetical protein